MAKQSTIALEFHRLNDGPRFAYQLKDWDTQPHTLKLVGRWGAKRDDLIYTLKTTDTVEGSYGDSTPESRSTTHTVQKTCLCIVTELLRLEALKQF